MDVDVIVAWWLNKCLTGEMTTEDLLAALQEVQSDAQSPRADSSHRLSLLTRQVRAVVASGDTDQVLIESLAVGFLGAHPSAVLDAHGAPDWHHG